MLISPFTLTGNAWRFYKKQPLLNQVIGWLLIIPLTLSMVLQAIIQQYSSTLMQNWNVTFQQLNISGFVIEFLFSIWILWGVGSILLIGQRIIKSSAGRTRTSFSSVRQKSKSLILPLLLTNIIRSCITLLLSLPYFLVILLYLITRSPEQLNAFVKVIVSTVLNRPLVESPEFPYEIVVIFLAALPLLLPVVIYQIRTTFYQVVIGIENTAYRNALKRSKQVTKGKTLATLFNVFGLMLCTFIPIVLLVGLVSSIIVEFDERLMLVTILFNAAGSAIALALYTLGTIELFNTLTTTKS